jgi:hypothetical protein
MSETSIFIIKNEELSFFLKINNSIIKEGKINNEKIDVF